MKKNLQTHQEIKIKIIEFLRKKALTICMALKTLDLDCHCMYYILRFALLPYSNLGYRAQFWKIAAIVKHFSVAKISNESE